MSEAKVQIVSTHLKNQKTHLHVFLFFQVVSSQRLELKSRCTDQISKLFFGDQSIEPIDEQIPIVYLIVKCVFTKKSIILIMDKPQM